MKLKPHQIKAVKESKDKWSLFFRMRVGKTPTAIRLVTGRAKSGLIICPKSLTTQWENEIKVWSDKPDVEFKVISRDQFKIHSLELPRYDAVVIDECHRIYGNYKSGGFKALDVYLTSNEVKFVWLLSGTPFTASSWSVYSYAKLLGMGWKWNDWSKTFFTKIKMGRRFIPIAKKGMDSQLQHLLKKLGTVIDLKDVAEVADDIDIIETFDLNAEQKRHIKAIDAELPIVRYGQQHQLESGTRKSDSYNEELMFPCEKDKRLEELMEDNKKIIIVCRYLIQIKKYEQLAQKKNRRFYTIRGGQKETAAEIAVRANSDENVIVFIQGDTCDGYDLKTFSVMIFASMSYSFVNYDQVKSRMKSMDKKTPNTYIHFITNGKSLDKAVYDNVSNKQDFSIQLYSQE